MFNLFSADGNGKVTFQDVKRMMKVLIEEDVEDDLFIKSFIKVVDSDGNGYMSKTEMDKHSEEKFDEEMFGIISAMWDTDGDGRLSIDELTSATNDEGIFS